MELLVQTAGSLVAILALAGLAWWMKLGGAPRLDGEDAVRRAANEVEDGFIPVGCACDGNAALARDSAGRIMIIRRHGNRFAGRVLGPGARAAVWRDQGRTAVKVDPGEARFGIFFCDIPNAEAWADAINRVNGHTHA